MRKILTMFSVGALILGALSSAPVAAAATSGALSSNQDTANSLTSSKPTIRAKKKAKKKKKTKVKTPKVYLKSVGNNLNVRIGPRLKKKSNYRFRLQRNATGKWTTVGTYRTYGKNKQTRQRSIKVDCGAYRVKVLKQSKRNRSATSKSYQHTFSHGRYTTDSNFVYYTPTCYQPTKRTYPVIVTFAPSGQRDAPGSYGALLKSIADKHGFIVMGYKHYQNNRPGLYFDYNTGNGSYDEEDLGYAYTEAKEDIDAAFKKFPIQNSRVVLLGTSGGGSFAHALNILYPGFAAAIVANTSMIWGEDSDGWWNGPDWWLYLQNHRTTTDYTSSRKQAIFFQSPTDFRYEEMLMNADLYRSKGWNVRQVEFEGGHKVAPKKLYEQEFDRLVKLPAWR